MVAHNFTQFPKSETQFMNAFYGIPDADKNGLPDPAFESENLIYVVPPYQMVLAWNMKPVNRIRINKKCADSLLAALDQIGRDFTIAERQKYHLDRFGGGYNFRMSRGSTKLSTHAWGAAIDLAPELNQMGVTYGSKPFMMPLRAVEAFTIRGWTWGGSFCRPDAMHFEACRK